LILNIEPLSEAERKKLVSEDILKDVSFDWSTLEKYIKEWERYKSVPMKQMAEWERLMNEKTEYMKTLKYSAETADEIEKDFYLILSYTQSMKKLCLG
jgi:hypothetical protein